MTTQIELNLASKKPKVEPSEVESFMRFLELNSQWHSADRLLGNFWLINFSPSEAGKRKLRALAEASNGLIISGQKGYRHIAHATPDEINHAASWLEHQAKLMAGRAQAIRRQAHKLVH